MVLPEVSLNPPAGRVFDDLVGVQAQAGGKEGQPGGSWV